MTARELLADLSARGAIVACAGDKLQVSAPKGVLTMELRSALAEHKDELLAILASRPACSECGQRPVAEHRGFFCDECAAQFGSSDEPPRPCPTCSAPARRQGSIVIRGQGRYWCGGLSCLAFWRPVAGVSDNGRHRSHLK